MERLIYAPNVLQPTVEWSFAVAQQNIASTPTFWQGWVARLHVRIVSGCTHLACIMQGRWAIPPVYSLIFPSLTLPQDKRSDDLLPTGYGWQWINSVQANLKSETKSKHLSLPMRADVPHHLCIVFGGQSTAKECSEIFEWNATKKRTHSRDAFKFCLEATASFIFCFVE